MDDRSSSQAPSDAATAREVGDAAAQEAPAPPAAGARPVRVLVSPVAAEGSAAGPVLPAAAYTGVLYLQQRHEWPPVPMQQQREDDEDPKKMRARWFNDMRGWLMVVAVQVATVTYQAGLDPPDGFKVDKDGKPESPRTKRYFMFFYFNTTAFVTSLAIIILLMNRSFYHSEAKVVALEIIVVLDMVGLMGAYWAGSTRKDQTAKYTLVLTVLVLFSLYVVYTVQLLPKLWRLAAEAVPRRARVGAGAAPAAPVPSQIDGARSSQPPQDTNVARSISAARRRGSSRLGVAGTEPSRMLSP
ncbi:unnamed protein product [Urochloa decumbens]|uniref:PGG domain-containing protein n=1 Tax=Urochloa decumbens TaxID=240449 RepID=A0ABC9E3W5_9POAL